MVGLAEILKYIGTGKRSLRKIQKHFRVSEREAMALGQAMAPYARIVAPGRGLDVVISLNEQGLALYRSL